LSCKLLIFLLLFPIFVVMAKGLTTEEKLSFLFDELKDLKKENKELRKEIDRLNNRLSKYETPKNSSNSSKPPSSDFPKQRNNNSLRKPSGKKPGGQKGRKGNTLKMVAKPDKIEEYTPNYCPLCGRDLTSLPAGLVGSRQVIDIPAVQPIVTEHRVYQKQCTCSHCIQGSFPSGINTPVSYGPGVLSLVAYLNARQYIPIKRAVEMLNHIFNLSISTGGVSYLLNKITDKAQPALEAIRQQVLGSSVIGADETGVNINGKNHWAWTFQNEKATYIAVHPSRGVAAIEAIMPEGFEDSILVTDCWRAYFKFGAMNHQLCLAHLQRDLLYLKQRFPNNTWINKIDALIRNALLLHKNQQVTKEKVEEVQRSFVLLLEEPITNKDLKELITFQKRLVKYQDYIFGFLSNPQIPPDNNGSERAVRNFKVKQKVSGFFKSDIGSQIYATLRSIIDTAIKNNQNPYQVMRLLAKC